MAELSTVLQRADQIRRELLSIGRGLLVKARSFEIPEPDNGLPMALDQLDDNTYQVLVIGEAKRGKSTLVNALIGRPLLPTNVDIATNQAFRVCPSTRDAYRLRFEDGSSKEITAEELSRYGSQVCAEGDEIPSLNEIIRWIEVDVPARFIPPNVRIIDTPGLGSLYASHGQITRRFIPHAHAVIFVLESQAPISQPELDILEEVLTQTQNVFFVQTKIDQFTKEDWQSIRRRNETILREKFGDRLADVRVWPVSSLNLQKAVETGDPDYEVVSRGREMIQALQEFLFYVAGWSRLAYVLALLRDYHREGQKLLSYRLKTIEEGEQRLLEARRELIGRRDQFEGEWGHDGRKREELLRKLDRGIETAEKEFAAAVEEVYEGLRREVEAVASMRQLNSLAKSLHARITEQIEMAWSNMCTKYRDFVLQTLKPFLEDSQESAIVPPVARLQKADDIAAPGVSKLKSSSNLETLAKALLPGLPEGTLGVGVLTLGQMISLPLLGTILSPVTLPLGIVLIGYALFKTVPAYMEARQQQLDAARRQFLNDLNNVFRNMRRTLVAKRLEMGLESPIRKTLGEVRDQLLDEIESFADRQLREMAEEIDRLDQDSKLARRERHEKCSQLQSQLTEWKTFGPKLAQIEGVLSQIRETRISA